MTELWFPENQLHTDMKKPTMQGFWNKPQTVQERQDCAALRNSRHILCTSSHSLFWKSRWHFREDKTDLFTIKILKNDLVWELSNISATPRLRFDAETHRARQFRGRSQLVCAGQRPELSQPAMGDSTCGTWVRSSAGAPRGSSSHLQGLN